MQKTSDIIILGAGLSGLLIAAQIREKSPEKKVLILEARPQPGGRIRTVRSGNSAPVEMGATWLNSSHTRLLALIDKLGLDLVQQFTGQKAIYEFSGHEPHQIVHLPENGGASFRVKGGSDRLIHALIKKLDGVQIRYNEPVTSIFESKENKDSKKGAAGLLSVETSGHKEAFLTGLVISTLPPRLLTATVNFTPALPDEVMNISSQTHTWMSESIKSGFTYAPDNTFWLRPDSAATFFSNAGPLTEMYDQSIDGKHALVGFMHDSFHSRSKKEREGLALEQLNRFFGKSASGFMEYHECVWSEEVYTHSPHKNFIVPHQNNGHPIFRQPLMDGRLILAGTETAATHPGYMEGAVIRAEEVVRELGLG
ncbi:MAG: FAD-dependent oxidoreductase [Balneolia bacterium]|nr:FAD-dependent oxidoreductase [Balneolia bacterium]